MIEIVILAAILLPVLAFSAILTSMHYPLHKDVLPGLPDLKAPRRFYEGAYRGGPPVPAEDDDYVSSAREHGRKAGIVKTVETFVKEYDLTTASALEVGCGSGLLQDLTDQYVGVDLSLSAHRFIRRPFVQASATQLPFPDGAFDAVWSIWVLEHVTNPEQALHEIRRVVKDGGYVLLRPAWDVDSWASKGYEVRPYSDFGWKGKLIKASIPVRSSRWYKLFYARQVRILRTLFTVLSGSASELRYKRLEPNYSKFWVTDSDAAVSLDFYEVFLWFHSRGDECVNCPRQKDFLFGGTGGRRETMIVRVNKSERSESRDMSFPPRHRATGFAI
ncbi:MAG TPA: class I SAM-dependent methyltransferase [Candidatus Acidoferrales bacterium]|nr:class I SAM-dependent methyltransferase [Candidatus Acidoferrales bacterium]